MISLVAVVAALLYGFLTARQGRADAREAQGRAEREAAIAEAANRFLSEELLVLNEESGVLEADPRNRDIRLRTVLERAAERVEGQFADYPQVEAVLRHSIAASFFSLGDFEEAGRHAERALFLREADDESVNGRVLDTMRLLASVRAAQGRIEDAEALLDRLVAATGEGAEERDWVSMGAEAALLQADILFERGKIAEAQDSYRRIIATSEAPAHIRISARSGEARIAELLEARAVALQKHAAVLTEAEKELGAEDPLTSEVARRFARALAGDIFDMGMGAATDEDVTNFVKLAKMARKRQEDRLGMDHPATLRTRFDLAAAFGDHPALAAGAMRDLEAIVEAAQSVYRPDHPELLRFRIGLAHQHARGGDHQKAVEEYETIIESGLRSVGESHPVVVDATRRMAESLAALERTEEADGQFQLALTRARKELSPAADSRRKAVWAAGEFYWSQDRTPDAVDVFRQGFLSWRDEIGSAHRYAAMFLDCMLLSMTHDRVGAAADMLAQRSLRVGGTPFPMVRALYQLSVASHLCLRPSHFTQSPVPLPESYYRFFHLGSTESSEPRNPVEAAVPVEASWRYLVLGHDELPPEDWEGEAFDDDDWSTGPAPIGWGDTSIATDVRDTLGKGSKPARLRLRHRIAMADANAGQPILLRVRSQGEVVVKLNGSELVHLESEQVKGEVAETETHTLLVNGDSLQAGNNLVTVAVNRREGDSGLFLSLELFPNAPTPSEMLADLNLDAALAHLATWLPGPVEPLDDDWRTQVEGATHAMLGQWDRALALVESLSPERRAASQARIDWFRRECLRRLGRKEEAQALFRESFPPRASDTPGHLIDLTDYYTARLDEPWYVTRNGLRHEADLARFPVGVNRHGGAEFDVRGILQLGSPMLTQEEVLRDYPLASGAIPVGQKVDTFQLLNGCLYHGNRDEVVAKLLIRYADGGEAELPVRYQYDTLTMNVGVESGPDTVKEVWRGEDPSRPESYKALYLASLSNPHPEKVVESITLRASPSTTAFFVLGITIDPRRAGLSD